MLTLDFFFWETQVGFGNCCSWSELRLVGGSCGETQAFDVSIFTTLGNVQSYHVGQLNF